MNIHIKENKVDYIVGITEQELEFYYNESTGLSNWSSLTDKDKAEVVHMFQTNLRLLLFRYKGTILTTPIYKIGQQHR